MTNLFDRCPATTGIPVESTHGCNNTPDRAHRCCRPANHISYASGSSVPASLPPDVSHADHVCICYFVWTSGPSMQKRMDELTGMNRPEPTAADFVASSREIQLPIPYDMAIDFITSPDILSRQPVQLLRLGMADIGEWQIVAMDVRYDRSAGNHYVATLIRKD
jgi:hypothetical protein